jgi:uncharacterized membrane protein YcjF (UPF0283 family)
MDNNEFEQNVEQTENQVEHIEVKEQLDEQAKEQETLEVIEQQPEPPKINWKKEIFEWTEAIVIAVVIAVCFSVQNL